MGVVAGKPFYITRDEAASTAELHPDEVSGKAVSARLSYQAGPKDLTVSAQKAVRRQ